MFIVVLPSLQKDQDVVSIHHDELIHVLLKNIFHNMLEENQAIRES